MLHRVQVGNLSGLLKTPDVRRVGPVCMTCTKIRGNEYPVDDIQLKNEPGHSAFAEWLIRCHGKEELVTVNMGSADWNYVDAGQRMTKQHWFNPAEILGDVIEQR